MKKIRAFLKSLDPVKFSLDFFTVSILICFIVEFFRAEKMPPILWLADFYKIALPLCVGYHEINRWWPSSAEEKSKEPWSERKKIIQGEYYVLGWVVVPVILISLEIILPRYFNFYPEKLLSLSEWVLGIFLASNGSKKAHQAKATNQAPKEK